MGAALGQYCQAQIIEVCNSAVCLGIKAGKPWFRSKMLKFWGSERMNEQKAENEGSIEACKVQNQNSLSLRLSMPV